MYGLIQIVLLVISTFESANGISMLYEQPIGCDIGHRTDPGPALARSSSKIWYEGYKAGCTQFLQNYIPDHRDGKSLVIGIAGGSGSGKTTIKDVIVEQLSPVLPNSQCYLPESAISPDLPLCSCRIAFIGSRAI